MKRQKFVYNPQAGDNMIFVYIPKMEQKANFVCKELSEMPEPANVTRQNKSKQLEEVKIYKCLYLRGGGKKC
jgi:hypothetical protein